MNATGWKLRRRNRVVRAVRICDQEVDRFTRPRLHPEIADAVVARSLDLTWLRDEHGVAFRDVEYARVGTRVELDFDALKRIADFCPVDDDRLSDLRVKVEHSLAAVSASVTFDTNGQCLCRSG